MMARPSSSLLLIAITIVGFASARDAPDCGENTCHKLAYCDYPDSLFIDPAVDPRPAQCICQPGTLDKNWNEDSLNPFWPGMNGTDCDPSGWTIRYVAPIDVASLFPAWNVTNPAAQIPMTLGYLACLPNLVGTWAGTENEVKAKGYYLRSVPNWQGNPLTDPPVFEINCLYEERPTSIPSWFDILPDGIGEFMVPPTIYRWELETTDNALQIAPTGLTVDSVNFKPNCSETGCWVIKGTMTTGEAFNEFEAFNTFFLPQADITAEHPQGDLSYDYDYSDVEWTFSPANHPCTSVGFKAGVSDIDKISTCCINDPENDDEGGFVANYRPTENFVAWASTLRCDHKFTSASGEDKCWKVYPKVATWDQAKLTCAAAGGNLVSIANQDENTRLARLIQAFSLGETWIGLKSRPAQLIIDDLSSLGDEEDLGLTSEMFFEWVDTSLNLDYTADWVQQDSISCLTEVSEVVETNAPGFWASVAGIDFVRDKNYTFLRQCVGEAARGALRPAQNGTWFTVDADLAIELPGFVCDFPPPTDCIPHVIQRPNYAAPQPKPDTCWEAHTDALNWTDAQSSCAAAGGNLVSVKDAEDHFFLRRVAKHAGLDQAYWIGLRDGSPDQGAGEDGTGWYWAGDNTAAAYTAWADYDYWYWGRLKQELLRAWNDDCYMQCTRWWWGVCWTSTEICHDPEVRATWETYSVEEYSYFDDVGYGFGFYGYTYTASVFESDSPLLNFLFNLFMSGTESEEDSGFFAATGDCATHSQFDALWHREECSEAFQYVCEVPRANAGACHSDEVTAEDDPWDIPFPLQYQSFLGVGQFKGMPVSPGVVNFTAVDPFFGQYEFEIQLDEVELRSKAGKLRGTVGVEHTVDTFLGLANFRPTGIAALDTFATQVNIHLEKTSFFSVSTHGVNEYTFLEYVNMRLVMILNEDADNSGASEAGDRTVRTNRTGNAAYVQVTFTMGEQYQPNLDSGGLVPLDSVRAGMGTFFDDVNLASGLEHLCVEYVEANATIDESFGLTGYTGGKDTYNTLVGQTCSPQSAMCASPTSVPDQFVSFNIPLGFEVFDGMASNDLSNNIFVEFVVNALDTTATGAPNSGDDPMQMKTTLTASIPIVDGGVNIFCDGVVAKTDLKDVADVDIVVGSAVNASELTRLRILEDIASTDLSSVSSQRIDTASIESALMTLVLKGNHSYFLTGASNTGDYTMELDDVITLHMMVDGDGTASNSKEAAVLALMAQPGDDNQDSNGLDTDGYALNGAFYFTIERDQNKAHLEPSDLLLAQCPFNPPRPAANSLPLESCILRRDVRNRIYPNRQGAPTTAMEIVAATVPVKDSTKGHIDGVASAMGPSSDESTFLTNILGASDYTRELAVSFARAIHERYELNGRYRRAFWINPGYEWTPTQTAGRSIFSVSQKIYLFALISLDENWTRRRMLLQTARSGSEALEEQSAGMNAASLAFDVTPKSMLASSFDVPVDRVATFAVEMQLTEAEACMSAVDLQASLRATFEDYLTKSASGFHTVQVTKMEVDMGGHQCASNRRSLRKLLAGFSAASAVVEMLVVFKEGSASTFNDKLFAEQAGITSVRAVDVSPKVSINADYKCETNCGPSSGQGQNSDSDLSSSNTAMIAGIAGGVGGALVVGGAVAMLMRKKDDEPIPAVQTINVNDLKAQLADEV